MGLQNAFINTQENTLQGPFGGGLMNSFYDLNEQGKIRAGEYGQEAITAGGGIASALGQTGVVNQDAWSNAGTVGTTGVSSFMGEAGQIAGQFGTIGSAIGAGLSGLGGMVDLFGYDQDVDAIKSSYQSGQVPTFDLSSFAQSTGDFMDNFKKSSNKKIGQAAVGGAAAGAAFGPVGAVIGGAAGAVGGLAGKLFAKNKAQEAEQEMKREYSSAISRFNTASGSFFGRQGAQDRYRANQANQFSLPAASPYFYTS